MRREDLSTLRWNDPCGAVLDPLVDPRLTSGFTAEAGWSNSLICILHRVAWLTTTMTRFVALTAVFLPFLEIPGFILVSSWIGVIPMLVLVVAGALGGILVLQRVG